ncbi:tetraspanin-8-like [Nerophis lumbriciformis]|uniref:tetraspanin-8-like n=1 Tax=Nerophis lumbriciformis TaxID=546530 RepID=UPI002AE04135|nr:tetraspanin-8-like [Nerophis lumbriciformis]XP_061817401.1 tetraspanin-8-like [Nerophis lumbriciformis]XP_061817402.1 tetraspanin-8-like [Nerophis lumbriciformis]XP_061817403.1 tetraspanin-8-like [Nerophis lumbriciformis]
MGRVNIWVKRSFIVVASLMVVIGALMLAGTLFIHGHYHRDEQIEDMIVGIRAVYAISIIVLLLPIIGLYGVCKEKRWVIIVFTVGIILCSLFVLYSGINVLVVRPMVVQNMHAYYMNMQPIRNATDVDLKILHETQIQLECCGVQQGYQEWGYDIPESCLCVDNSTSSCVAAPKNSSLFKTMDAVMIYEESCLPSIVYNIDVSVNIAMGFSAGLILLWTLSCVLSVVVLCQLKPKKDTPTVAYSREAKTGNYAVLTEPAELP